MSAWAEHLVEDVAARTPHALATGPFGSSISSRFFQTDGVPVIRGSNLSQDVGTRLVDTDWVFISRDKAAEFTRSIVRSGDLIFTCWGTIDQVGLIDSWSPYSEYVISNKQMKLTPDSSRFNSYFLYYLFKGPHLRKRIRGMAIGSSVPGFNLGQLRSMRVRAPELAEQQKIAQILCALDDKIQLNRRLNRDLQNLATALFASWFVDFDPVVAKRDGKVLVGVPAEAVDLFPNRFEDSEFGPIPQGWRIGRLGEVAQIIDCLHSKKPERRDSGRPLLQLNNILDNGLLDFRDLYLIDEVDYAKWTERIEACAGDCVITNVGRVGAVAQLPVGFRAALGRNMTALRSTIGAPTFLIECLLSEAMAEEIERKTDSGTILNALNVRSLPNLRFVMPCCRLVACFERICRPLRALMESNANESRTLAELRDTLLGPLLSGELTIKSAQTAIGAAL
jgi:type I restriction enzyme, S subunit